MDARHNKSSALARLRRLGGDGGGSVSVGFSLVVGLLIALVAASLEFGRVMMARSEMDHALGRAARMVIMDGTQTPTEVADMMRNLLADYDPDSLEITAGTKMVAGVDYVTVSVEFPVETSLPFQSLDTVTLRVNTAIPIVRATFAGP